MADEVFRAFGAEAGLSLAAVVLGDAWSGLHQKYHDAPVEREQTLGQGYSMSERKQCQLSLSVRETQERYIK